MWQLSLAATVLSVTCVTSLVSLLYSSKTEHQHTKHVRQSKMKMGIISEMGNIYVNLVIHEITAVHI